MRAPARIPYLLLLVLLAWFGSRLLHLPLGEPAFRTGDVTAADVSDPELPQGLGFANILLLGCMLPPTLLALALLLRGGPPFARIPHVLSARPFLIAAAFPIAIGLAYGVRFLQRGDEADFARGAAMFLALLTFALLALRWGNDTGALRTGFARLGGIAASIGAAAALLTVALHLLPGNRYDRVTLAEILAIRPLYREPNAEYVYPGQAGNRREFTNLVRNNSLGYHDIERTVEKPEGVTRILVLGDSFVEARQLPIGSSFHAILERNLNGTAARFEVIPIGRGGASQPQELEMLREDGLAYDPDLLLHLFVTNDVFGNPDATVLRAPALRMQKAWHPQPSVPRALFSRRWNLDLLITDRLHRLAARYGYLVDPGLRLATIRSDFWAFLEPPPPAFLRGLAVTERALDEILATCGSRGIRPMIALAPQFVTEESLRATHPALRDHDLNTDFYGEWLGRYCAERGVPFLDLAHAFARHARAGGDPVTWQDDLHWNETGHRVVAEAIARFVRESGLLPE